jgi:hypothetical protein
MKTYKGVEIQLYAFLTSALHAEDPVLKTTEIGFQNERFLASIKHRVSLGGS